MSKTYLEPATDHILVADGVSVTTIGDIDMPENAKQKDMVAGSVIFVGPDAHRTNPADTVLYGPYAGKGVVVDGVEFRLLREGQIEAYLRKSN